MYDGLENINYQNSNIITHEHEFNQSYFKILFQIQSYFKVVV